MGTNMHEDYDAHNTPEDDPQLTSGPADFSEDERLFVQELSQFFDTEGEDLPPYFVQTLLDAHHPRFDTADEAMVRRGRVQVMRTLQLKRRIFRPASPFRPLALPRSFALALCACVLFLCTTMMLALPAFNAGVTFLLTNPHKSIAQMLHTASPVGILRKTTLPPTPADAQAYISLNEAQNQLHFPMYWPLAVPTDYQLGAIYLYQGSDQQWADGPIVDLEYAPINAATTTDSSSRITICEFKPASNTVQEVQISTSEQLQVDSKGTMSLLIDGQWEPLNTTHQWAYGAQGELLYELNGVLFWIDGNQRNSITKDTLLAIANSLNVLNPQQVTSMMTRMGTLTEGVDDPSNAFIGQAIDVNNLHGSFTAIVGDAPSPNKGMENSN